MSNPNYERSLEAANEQLQERLEEALERLDKSEGLANDYERFRSHIFIHNHTRKQYDPTKSAIDSLWSEFYGNEIEEDPDYQPTIDRWEKNNEMIVAKISEVMKKRNVK